ncbi:hypothetical protein FHW69_001610 [Luteibacter sp. Sphag1AF]|nr:hypothetical protein [Luteibacter sp. Sphag1AF]
MSGGSERMNHDEVYSQLVSANNAGDFAEVTRLSVVLQALYAEQAKSLRTLDEPSDD